MKKSEVARTAHQELKERGWIQGQMMDYCSGHVCLVGAIREALGWPDSDCGVLENAIHNYAYALLNPVLDLEHPFIQEIEEDVVWTYNDNVLKNQAEAEEVLLQAADYWVSQGD